VTIHIGPRIRVHTVDYRRDDRPGRRGLLNRGFWIYHIPRPLVACRLLGHKPVIDGTGPLAGDRGARWVCCDRCGVRPDPQGTLDPEEHAIGQAYTGGYTGVLVMSDRGKPSPVGREPGPWPVDPDWTLGGQLLIGGDASSPSIEVKVGNAGSEHTLAAHLTLGRAGALYLHTEELGTWLQRRLNPVGYQSRVIGLSMNSGRLHWQLWARRDEWSRDDPKWMQGSVVVDPRDRLLGPKRYAYTDHAGPVQVLVRMPHGDDHPITVALQRQTFGRARGRKRLSWSVDWNSTPGIPTKPGGGGRVSGSAVPVTASVVDDGTWPMAAAAAIAARLTADRSRYGWDEQTVHSGG
jgi:hypothetical protein